MSIDVSDPLKPSPALLAKLGSIIVHADEYISSSTRYEIDALAFASTLSQPDVQKWLRAMTKLALVPVKRS